MTFPGPDVPRASKLLACLLVAAEADTNNKLKFSFSLHHLISYVFF